MQIKGKQLEKRNTRLIKADIVFFAILFLTCSFTVTNNIISSAVTMVLWVMAAIFLMFSFSSTQRTQYIILILLLFSMLVSVFVNGENFRNAVCVFFSIGIVFLYVGIYSFEEFRNSFIRVMSFLCVVSLIGFLAYMLFPALNNINVTENTMGNIHSNLIIYVDYSESVRNIGMFWEPGAFQTFIALAMLFEITGKKTSIKKLLLFAITIITTFSTTGYLALALVLVVGLFLSHNDNGYLKIVIGFFIVGIAVFIYVNQEALFDTSQYTVFGKLVSFFEEEHYKVEGAVSSVTVRFNAIVKPIEAFIEKPFFGWGYQGLADETHKFTLGMNTCTFVNWFAVYGVFFGAIMLWGFVKLARKIGKNWFVSFLVLAVLFVVTMSENYVNNASIIILAFYGFRFEPKEEQCENFANQLV